jgi:hypothetical protein
MLVKGGATSFKEKYYHFMSKSTKGKIMFLESYKGKVEEIEWGKGAILILKNASPFFLNIVKDWFLEKPTRIAGDIAGLLIHTVKKNRTKNLKKSMKNIKYRADKCKLQLHNILRKQNSTITIKNKKND